MIEKTINIKTVDPEEYKRAEFDYHEYISTFVEGFVSDIFTKGIIDEIKEEELKKYFSNPDKYQEDLEKLAEYYYISNGDIFQLFEMAKVLPTLNYKIESFDKPKQYDKHIALCNKILSKVKHKSLTRDIISQTITAGTLCGIWLGEAKNPYFYIFDNLNKVFPAHRINGEWVVAVDMSWLEEMSDSQRELFLLNLDPFITLSDYDNYLKDREKNKYKYLPQDRTAVIRTHTLKRNQNRGISWVTQGLYDILHKKKLRDLEKAVANKIINAIAVLTIGSEKNDNYTNMKLSPSVKRKLHSRVKQALETNEKNGLTLISIPDYSKIDFPEIKSGDSLDPNKFESINNDIDSSIGLSTAIKNGNSSNYASAKINLDAFYRRLAILLEEIEDEVYSKLFNLILPSSQKDNYKIVYDKDQPLTNKEKVDILMRLHSQEGFSLKAVIDAVAGVDFNTYLDQSIYEQEELEIPKRITPYASAYTASPSNNKDSNDVGRPPISDNDIENENTRKSKENDSNNTPK